MMRDDLRRFVMLAMFGLIVLFAPWAWAQDDTAPSNRTSAEARATQNVRRLIEELRVDLAAVENQIRHHPYLGALERGEVSLDNLRAFAGEQYHIIRSDLRSDAHLVARFGATPAGQFFRGIFEGEVIALDLLLDFAAALGLTEKDLAAYEPKPQAQAFPSYVVSLAYHGTQADVATAFLVNFPVFGENTGRMSAALQKQYGLTPKQTAFFDFFATPVPGFEAAALAVIAGGLETDGDPRQLRRAARLLQAYELAFWDSVAEN